MRAGAGSWRQAVGVLREVCWYADVKDVVRVCVCVFKRMYISRSADVSVWIYDVRARQEWAVYMSFSMKVIFDRDV